MIRLTITGQLPSGKNQVQITRTGHRYPNARFAKWRDKAVAEVGERLPFPPEIPLDVMVEYTPGDLRRRDTPGMLDAIYHVLERAKLVADDKQFQNVVWKQLPLDRTAPRADIAICTATNTALNSDCGLSAPAPIASPRRARSQSRKPG